MYETVGVGVNVGLGDGARVGVALDVGLGVGLRLDVGGNVGLGVGLGVGVALIPVALCNNNYF